MRSIDHSACGSRSAVSRGSCGFDHPASQLLEFLAPLGVLRSQDIAVGRLIWFRRSNDFLLVDCPYGLSFDFRDPPLLGLLWIGEFGKVPRKALMMSERVPNDDGHLVLKAFLGGIRESA